MHLSLLRPPPAGSLLDLGSELLSGLLRTLASSSGNHVKGLVVPISPSEHRKLGLPAMPCSALRVASCTLTRLVCAQNSQVSPAGPFLQRDVLRTVQVVGRERLRRVVEQLLRFAFDALGCRWRRAHGLHCEKRSQNEHGVATIRPPSADVFGGPS